MSPEERVGDDDTTMLASPAGPSQSLNSHAYRKLKTMAQKKEGALSWREASLLELRSP